MHYTILAVRWNTGIVRKIFQRRIRDADLVISDLCSCRQQAISTLENISDIEIDIMILKVTQTAGFHDIRLIEAKIYIRRLLRSNRRHRYTACQHLTSLNFNTPMKNVPRKINEEILVIYVNLSCKSLLAGSGCKNRPVLIGYLERMRVIAAVCSNDSVAAE
jgi:hypothetical protein